MMPHSLIMAHLCENIRTDEVREILMLSNWIYKWSVICNPVIFIECASVRLHSFAEWWRAIKNFSWNLIIDLNKFQKKKKIKFGEKIWN